MSRLLVDTTFLIDADRSGGDLDAVIDDDDDVAIAAVTVAELRVGALLARGRHKNEERSITSPTSSPRSQSFPTTSPSPKRTPISWLPCEPKGGLEGRTISSSPLRPEHSISGWSAPTRPPSMTYPA